MRHIVRIVLGFLFAFLGAIFGGALLIASILGLSTVPDDYAATQGVVNAFLHWLLKQDPSLAATLLALGLFIVGAFLLLYEWSHYDEGGTINTNEHIAKPAPATARPVGGQAHDVSRAPTAAELLEEQELRDALRAIREFIEGSANDARSDLEGVMTEAARLYGYQGSKHAHALRFFVQEADRGYVQRTKTCIQGVKQALNDRSIDRAQQNLVRFMK